MISMQRFISILLLLLAAASSPAKVTPQGDSYKFHSAPGKSLAINLDTGGDILVTGAAGDDVEVTVRRSGRDSDDLDVSVQETPSGVEISSRYAGDRRNYNANADVEVTVPSRYDISIETMGGDVAIRGVEGKFSGQTMGGDLNLQQLKGTVNLTTMGGEIAVRDSHLDGEVDTMGGDVVLHNVTGDVQGSTMGGDVRREGTQSSTEKSSDEKRVHSMGGDIDLDSAPNGANLETMGGDIHVISASNHVRAKTMGGDIQVDSIDGWANLVTMGGDVIVHMSGNSSTAKRDADISSMGGDIELTLPADFSATFDLETEYGDNTHRQPRIISDFPIKVEETTGCEYDHHHDCQVLRGTGSIGNGTHRIKIRTVEGDIVIRRG